MPTAPLVPPVLYLPVMEHPQGGQYAIVRELSDRRRGLVAYTALDRLADQCGANQPWVLVPTAELGRIKEEQPFDLVLFDIDVPANKVVNGRIA